MDSKSDPPPDGLPSYSESVRFPRQNSSHSYLPRNIAATRTSLISSLLTTYITPHLHESALSGLSSTTLILVPANVSSLQAPGKIGSNGPSETIVGFPSAENLTMVRLQGQENGVEFWRQVAVMQELTQQLCAHLRSLGHLVIEDHEASLQGPNPPTAEWRTVQQETLGKGEVRVRVEMKEVCLRIENDMGLYETKSGKAVVVKVDFGA